MEEKIIQITSGKGPAECERVVSKLLQKIMKQAEREQLDVEIAELVPGKPAGTLLSALIRVKGTQVSAFCKSWEGTIQWIAQSPFRKFHKRKNWFAGIRVYDVSTFPLWNEKDVVYQSMRSSGPGGQHVNKTESAASSHRHQRHSFGRTFADDEQEGGDRAAEEQAARHAGGRTGKPAPRPVAGASFAGAGERGEGVSRNAGVR